MRAKRGAVSAETTTPPTVPGATTAVAETAIETAIVAGIGAEIAIGTTTGTRAPRGRTTVTELAEGAVGRPEAADTAATPEAPGGTEFECVQGPVRKSRAFRKVKTEDEKKNRKKNLVVLTTRLDVKNLLFFPSLSHLEIFQFTPQFMNFCQLYLKTNTKSLL